MKHLLIFLTAAAMFGQTPAAAPASEQVVGIGTFIHVVGDLDRSIEFYKALLGNEPNGAPGPRAYGPNPVIADLYGVRNSQSRFATIRVPGSQTAVEMVEWKGVERKPVEARVQDPGATILMLTVRDLHSTLARIHHSETAAGKVLLTDPDGFFIELAQASDPPSGEANVLGASIGITVGDTGKAMRLYKSILGFAPGKTEPASEPWLPARAKLRRTAAMVPGSTVALHFLEFKGVDRKPVSSTTRDPGTPVLRLFTHDVDGFLKATKAAGSKVVTTGGEPVVVGNNIRVAIVDGPDNLFLEPMQARQ
jgi:catechol 2,3-dioxygenase-like lactoylglutathione lyase family enzyme